MKKYAAIDIGTNSIRLLLCNVENGKIIKRTKYINSTRIGSFIDKEGIIKEEGIVKNLEVFNSFVKKAKLYGTEKIIAIATSAVRDAKNGEHFIQRAFNKTGVKIDIISGEKEAALGYKGVAIGLKQNKLNTLESTLNTDCKNLEAILVLDIGGGSTELILGEGINLIKTISLNVGAVRMTKRHISTEPVSKKEQLQMEMDIFEIIKNPIKQIKEKLAKLHKDSLYNNITLMGIGGTITTLVALHKELELYDPEEVHNYKLTLKDIVNLKKKLLCLTVDEIKNLKGIHPKRADIIVAGVTMLHLIMENLNIDEITASEYDNLEGLIL